MQISSIRTRRSHVRPSDASQYSLELLGLLNSTRGGRFGLRNCPFWPQIRLMSGKDNRSQMRSNLSPSMAPSGQVDNFDCAVCSQTLESWNTATVPSDRLIAGPARDFENFTCIPPKQMLPSQRGPIDSSKSAIRCNADGSRSPSLAERRIVSAMA